jgi:PAS domain S-box-containing protein
MGVTLGANSLTPLAPLLRSSLPMTANANLQALADQLLLQRYTPAAVMVTSTGDIVHISGKTGRYLEPATGKANWNVLAMAREGLSAAMSEAFYDAQRQHATVTLTAVQTGDDGVARSVEITVQPLSEPLALRGMLMIVFADVTTPAPPQLLGKAERTARQSARLKAMEQALQATREELQVTREEMQTSREELTSTNEELQSTNEELTTSAEELRTMNEELVRARSAAEHSLARYTDLFDSAPVGYVTIDRNSVITQANLLAAELLGLNRDQRVGGHLALFVVEADRPAFASCIERGFTSREAQLCEVALWRGSGPPRKVRVSALAADDGRACRVVVIDISEIREAEAALRESEERFRTLADHAPALIWMAGPDKLCTHFNQAWRDFTGRTIEQELGNGWAEVVHPDDLAQCWGIYSGSFDERKAFSMEYRLRRHDGEYRWLLDHGIPRFAANGTFLGYIGSCIDITERKQVDLEKDHERVVLEVLAQGGSLPELLARLVLSFETLLPGMRGSVLLLDADGRRLRHGAAPNLPPAYCQALDGAEIGANAGSCGTAAHSGRNVIVADIANDPLWNDYRDLALSHGLRACWSVPIFGRARRVLGTFAFYFTVPRAAHQSELATIDRGAHLASLAIERHLAETALAATTAMLERTGALARIGGWQLDLRDMKLLWSLEVFRIHELEPTTTPGIDTALGFYPPEAQPIARGMVRDAIDHGAPWDRELPLVTAKGRQRWVRTQGTAVMEGGKAIMLHGTIQDITERKLLEDELRQAQKMEAVGRLAGGIAHDFNNQLTVIQGYGSMALARTSDEAVAKCLTQIVNASDRSAKLVQQLLTFSRKGRHTVAQVDVHVLLSELLEVLGRSLSKLIRLRPALTARDPRIMGDAGLLQNALLNLALNSRDAMPSGGDLGFGTSLVEVDEEHAARLGGEIAPGPHLVITVSDSGLGMSEEVQRHLFEPFFSTKALGQGTGLGLASVYGTIKHHRGAIEVESAEGRGTTFRIYLPRAGCRCPRTRARACW